MPAARIYSLAKELKLDSKVLVDICTNAGVTGKGSALASLTDEEVDRVKAYLSGGSSGAKAPVARARPGAATTTIEPPADSGVVRREDYIAPTGTITDKMPVLDDRNKRKKPTNGDAGGKPPVTRSGSTPKLARLLRRLTANRRRRRGQVPELAAPESPNLQAADGRDQGGQSESGGTKPLIDHVRKQQGKRRDGADEGPAEGLPAKPSFPRERPSRPKEMISGDTPVAARHVRGRRGAPGKASGQGRRRPCSAAASSGNSAAGCAGAEARPRGEEEETPTPRAAAAVSASSGRTGTERTAAPAQERRSHGSRLPCTVRSFSEAIERFDASWSAALRC